MSLRGAEMNTYCILYQMIFEQYDLNITFTIHLISDMYNLIPLVVFGFTTGTTYEDSVAVMATLERLANFK